MKQLLSDTTVDLTNCAREPIHIPGSIQPHGMLFVLIEPALTILQVSENVYNFLSLHPDSILNQPLEKLIGQEQIASISESLHTENPATGNFLILNFEVQGEKRGFEGSFHRIDGILILELEPMQDEKPIALTRLQNTMKAVTTTLQKSANLHELCQVAAEEIYKISGFDRAMVYQFDEDWNGIVIAEVKRDGVETFLNLHFPASDIPVQARKLYLKNWLRIIADVHYQSAAMVPLTNPLTTLPVDMSFATLRSISPIHIEYLKNMEVAASMCISLIAEDRLWGLVVCHHKTPKYLSYTTRYTCEFLAQVTSSFLQGKEAYDRFMFEWKIRTVQGSLLGNLQKEENFLESLQKYSTSLLDLVNAKGLAIDIINRYMAIGGARRCINQGQCPAEEDVKALVAWLQSNVAEDMFVTDSLSTIYEPAQRFGNVASGLLAISLSNDKANFLLWFRPEIIQTVNWGGDPTKAAIAEEQGSQLHPRKSFEAWKQTIHMTSLPWEQSEIEAAMQIRGILADALTRDEIIKNRMHNWLGHR